MRLFPFCRYVGCAPGRHCPSQPFQVFFPFHGEQIFLAAVACSTGRCQVASSRSSPPGDRNDVIHGQCFRCEFASAIGAFSFGKLALPPLGFAERSGLFLLPSNCFGGSGHHEREVTCCGFHKSKRTRLSARDSAHLSATSASSKLRVGLAPTRTCYFLGDSDAREGLVLDPKAAANSLWRSHVRTD